MWMGFLSSSGRRLVWLGWTFGVTLKVDIDLTDALDVAALGVVGELFAIDLVEAVVAFAVHHDMHVLQVGMSALLELHGVGSTNCVNRASALGLGEGEPLAGLLNVDTKLFAEYCAAWASPLVWRCDKRP